MIVVDASVVLDLLLRGRESLLLDRVLESRDSLHAPHLLDLEVLQVLRRYQRAGELSPARALQAIDDFRAMRIERYSHELLVERVWALRRNLTAYDAAYVALAELLDATLLTLDGRLARSPANRARIELAPEV